MPDGNGSSPRGEGVTLAISAAMVSLYAEVYGHDRTTASTYINDDVVVCILQDILSSARAGAGRGGRRERGHRRARGLPG